MFHRVLAGVDGRNGGRDAIALARLLTAEDGQLVLAHVYPLRGDPLHRDYDDNEAAEYVHARHLLTAAREQAGVRAELRWTACTSAGRGLHELAETLGSDLLVVGASARGPLGRVIVGSGTRAAVEGAPCAVSVAPAGYAEHPAAIRKIGVGYDGSPESTSALDVAGALAYELGASLAPLEAYGHPAEEPALWCDAVDLLVIGPRGHGPVGRLMHGSTARALVQTAHCPLLVLSRSTPAMSAEGSGHDDRALAAI
jgi:nucleotide-binding universal stress UspA family protein